MILKNKALQIFDFLAAPTERLYERAAKFHLGALQEVLAGKSSLTPDKVQVFNYFPEVAGGLGEQALAHPQMSAAIKGDPLAALRMLLTNYPGFSATLEPLVLTSGEATYLLLKAARELKLTLNYTQESYLNTLLRDPFWALRYWGDTQDEKVLAACLQLAKEKKDTLPGAAYLHLYFTPEADPSDFVELLSTAPMYAYLASRHFYDRNIEFKYFTLRGLTPRWAYHFITDGFLDEEEGLIDTMLASPDWLVEYLVESERYKDLPYCKGLLDKVYAKAPNNPITTHLKGWWERTEEHVKKLPPPKPIKIPGAEKAPEATKTEEKKA